MKEPTDEAETTEEAEPIDEDEEEYTRVSWNPAVRLAMYEVPDGNRLVPYPERVPRDPAVVKIPQDKLIQRVLKERPSRNIQVKRFEKYFREGVPCDKREELVSAFNILKGLEKTIARHESLMNSFYERSGYVDREDAELRQELVQEFYEAREKARALMRGRKTEFVAPRTPAEEERLAELIRRGDRLVTYVSTHNYPNKEVAHRIRVNWNELKRTNKIGVTPPSTDTPGFVINKSDAMQLCLTTSPDKPHDLDELNLNTFVLIHEIAHLGAIEYEHGSEFMSVFRKLLRASLNIGIWKYVDYRKNPQMYCEYYVDATPTIPETFVAVYDDL